MSNDVLCNVCHYLPRFPNFDLCEKCLDLALAATPDIRLRCLPPIMRPQTSERIQGRRVEIVAPL